MRLLDGTEQLLGLLVLFVIEGGWGLEVDRGRWGGRQHEEATEPFSHAY
jgi:hypothetical protein